MINESIGKLNSQCVRCDVIKLKKRSLSVSKLVIQSVMSVTMSVIP